MGLLGMKKFINRLYAQWYFLVEFAPKNNEDDLKDL